MDKSPLILPGNTNPPSMPNVDGLAQALLVRQAQLRMALEASVAFDRFLRMVQAGGIPNDKHAYFVLSCLYTRYKDLTMQALEIANWDEYAVPEYAVDKDGNLYEGSVDA